MRSGELNWELTSASSGKDLASPERSHHADATGATWKITCENWPGPGQSHTKGEGSNVSTRESRGAVGQLRSRDLRQSDSLTTDNKLTQVAGTKSSPDGHDHPLHSSFVECKALPKVEHEPEGPETKAKKIKKLVSSS